MRALMLVAVVAMGCGTDSSVSPDEKKLSDFEEFTVWGEGMEDHSAPTSAGDDGDSDADADADADSDSDGDDGAEPDGGGSTDPSGGTGSGDSDS